MLHAVISFKILHLATLYKKTGYYSIPAMRTEQSSGIRRTERNRANQVESGEIGWTSGGPNPCKSDYSLHMLLRDDIMHLYVI